MENALLLWQTAGGQQEGSVLTTLLFAVAGLGIFYFFIMRPQKQQQTEQKNFSDGLKRGDKVVTSGGLHGSVTAVHENGTTDIMIAPKVVITVQSNYISFEMTKAVHDVKNAGITKGE